MRADAYWLAVAALIVAALAYRRAALVELRLTGTATPASSGAALVT